MDSAGKRGHDMPEVWSQVLDNKAKSLDPNRSEKKSRLRNPAPITKTAKLTGC